MNSSSEHLFDVAHKIGCYSHWANQTDSISHVKLSADKISNNLLGVNQNLSEGWKQVSNTIVKVHTLIRELTVSIANDIIDFASATSQNESSAVTAVNTANEKSQDVLSQLGIN